MSAFTEAEIEYLNSQGLGSNADLAGMAATKKFRDAHPFELSARDVGRQDLDGSGQ